MQVAAFQCQTVVRKQLQKVISCQATSMNVSYAAYTKVRAINTLRSSHTKHFDRSPAAFDQDLSPTTFQLMNVKASMMLRKLK